MSEGREMADVQLTLAKTKEDLVDADVRAGDLAAEVNRLEDRLRSVQHVADIYRAGVESRLKSLESEPVPGNVRRVLREITGG